MREQEFYLLRDRVEKYIADTDPMVFEAWMYSIVFYRMIRWIFPLRMIFDFLIKSKMRQMHIEKLRMQKLLEAEKEKRKAQFTKVITPIFGPNGQVIGDSSGNKG
jgi:hypothetical protein